MAGDCDDGASRSAAMRHAGSRCRFSTRQTDPGTVSGAVPEATPAGCPAGSISVSSSHSVSASGMGTAAVERAARAARRRGRRGRGVGVAAHDLDGGAVQIVADDGQLPFDERGVEALPGGAALVDEARVVGDALGAHASPSLHVGCPERALVKNDAYSRPELCEAVDLSGRCARRLGR